MRSANDDRAIGAIIGACLFMIFGGVFIGDDLLLFLTDKDWWPPSAITLWGIVCIIIGAVLIYSSEKERQR